MVHTNIHFYTKDCADHIKIILKSLNITIYFFLLRYQGLIYDFIIPVTTVLYKPRPLICFNYFT